MRAPFFTLHLLGVMFDHHKEKEISMNRAYQYLNDDIIAGLRKALESMRNLGAYINMGSDCTVGVYVNDGKTVAVIKALSAEHARVLTGEIEDCLSRSGVEVTLTTYYNDTLPRGCG